MDCWKVANAICVYETRQMSNPKSRPVSASRSGPRERRDIPNDPLRLAQRAKSRNPRTPARSCERNSHDNRQKRA